MFERALSLRPRTPAALLHKADLYERKGLVMAAIAEMEALVEFEPRDLPAHRKLILLYKSQKMVHEHNIEVRRFKAIMEKKGPAAPP
jgi:DNA-binding SARP family transcriptional activator